MNKLHPIMSQFSVAESIGLLVLTMEEACILSISDSLNILENLTLWQHSIS